MDIAIVAWTWSHFLLLPLFLILFESLLSAYDSATTHHALDLLFLFPFLLECFDLLFHLFNCRNVAISSVVSYLS